MIVAMSVDRGPITVRFDKDLNQEVEEYIDEHDMFKVDFFEKAAREFMDKDRYSRVEEKLDELLDRTEELGGEGGVSRETETEKKERVANGGVSPTDSNTNDASLSYDPNMGMSGTLSTDELRSILTRDEPKVNVDDIGTLPRSTSEKSKLIAAVVRYRNSGKTPAHEIKDAISAVVGSSDHLLDTYLNDEPVGEHFYQQPIIDEETFEVKDGRLWILDVETYRSELREKYQTYTTAAETPVYDEYPTSGYSYSHRWLGLAGNDLVEHGIATDEEIEAVRDALVEHRQQVDALIRGFAAAGSRHVPRTDLIESCDLPQETATKVLDLLLDAYHLEQIDDTRIRYDTKPPRRPSHSFA